MKRALTIAFSMLMMCCLLLGAVIVVQAAEPGYEIAEAYDTTPVTLDGSWAPGEWEDSWIEYMNASAVGERFCYKASSALLYAPEFLIDSADNTSDAGDIWQICIGSPEGGNVPLAGHNKIEIVGHQTLTVYVGNGAGWVQVSSSPVTWFDNITVNQWPLDYEHWCVEVIINKAELNTIWNGPPPLSLRVAMYDESKDLWVAWPPQSDPNIPEGWGQILGGNPSIPEGFSFGILVLLSSVAIAVGFYFVRKRPKTRNYCAEKTGEIHYAI
ncbi:MAG: hypothetical protein NWE84_01775 [Candidatus Bathyarchaeota archaeon]|nr:hypothetical protein [Candidatus Bathyarchaeota archaeon]